MDILKERWHQTSRQGGSNCGEAETETLDFNTVFVPFLFLGGAAIISSVILIFEKFYYSQSWKT